MSSESKQVEFVTDLASVINKHGVDNELSMADFILAYMIMRMLSAVKQANQENKAKGYDKVGEE